jgi:hypothetical protein
VVEELGRRCGGVRGAAGPRSVTGTVMEESGLTGGGGHVDLDDRAREGGSGVGRTALVKSP